MGRLKVIQFQSYMHTVNLVTYVTGTTNDNAIVL